MPTETSAHRNVYYIMLRLRNEIHYYYIFERLIVLVFGIMGVKCVCVCVCVCYLGSCRCRGIAILVFRDVLVSIRTAYNNITTIARAK